MNHCAIQQGNALSACDDMRACSRDSVVCPKPRRFGLLSVTHNDPVRSLRWHLGHQAELYDSKAGSDILDILLPKGSFGVEPFSCTEIASPHPFFCGSPPSRVANPLIQDARFGDEKPTPLSPLSPTAPPLDLLSSPSSSARKGGFVRASFGNKPAVRVEGFDCLDRDRRNCSIPTLA
ncbi:uncharacterized protein LOC103947614 [Pyrus x bretschneideri]|uniref:uncharacterized protein LOC103947614 n=1 Tax=Pyrus x bretschneideri TaxID=225117 RepID=UPI000510D243|nr:uncharacterized protein LOC103947614 [Pyrus x bretschneideri]